MVHICHVLYSNMPFILHLFKCFDIKSKVGGLNLSRSCHDLDTFKKLVSTIKKILTLTKIWSWRSRSLDRDQEVLILSRHHLSVQKVSIKIRKSWFCLDTTFQSQKSWSRSRNPTRHEIFGQSQQFVLISIETELILSFFLINISQFVKIFEPEVPQKSFDNVNISL